MLDSAYNNLPDSAKGRERFVIPKIRGHLEGVKTIVSNFGQIVQSLNRPQEHIIKFLLKEVAAPGEIRGTDLIIGRRVSATMLNEKIKKYADIHVICGECGKPDTKMVKENNMNYLVCQACGNKQLIRG